MPLPTVWPTVHLAPLVATVRALPPGLFWLGPILGAASTTAPRARYCGNLGRLLMSTPLLSPPAIGRRVSAGACRQAAADGVCRCPFPCSLAALLVLGERGGGWECAARQPQGYVCVVVAGAAGLDRVGVGAVVHGEAHVHTHRGCDGGGGDGEVPRPEALLLAAGRAEEPPSGPRAAALGYPPGG